MNLGYLEGLDAGVGQPPAGSAPGPSTPKRRRISAFDVVLQLKEAKALKDAAILSSPELKALKERLLNGD